VTGRTRGGNRQRRGGIRASVPLQPCPRGGRLLAGRGCQRRPLSNVYATRVDRPELAADKRTNERGARPQPGIARRRGWKRCSRAAHGGLGAAAALVGVPPARSAASARPCAWRRDGSAPPRRVAHPTAGTVELVRRRSRSTALRSALRRRHPARAAHAEVLASLAWTPSACRRSAQRRDRAGKACVESPDVDGRSRLGVAQIAAGPSARSGGSESEPAAHVGVRRRPWIESRAGGSFAVPTRRAERIPASPAWAPETRRAIDAAGNALPAWRTMLAKDRARRTLRRWADLDDRARRRPGVAPDDPRRESRSQVPCRKSPTRVVLEWFGEEGKRIYGDTIPTYRRPSVVGVNRSWDAGEVTPAPACSQLHDGLSAERPRLASPRKLRRQRAIGDLRPPRRTWSLKHVVTIPDGRTGTSGSVSP